jgi:RimJ/RimL family protein N-acetyltransferase
MTPPTLLTDRLVLRPHTEEDFEPAAAMWSDPDVVRFVGGAVRPRRDVWTALLRGRGLWDVKGFGYWAICERRSGRFLGEGGFADFKRGLSPDLSLWPEAGWAFARDAWGMGIGTEAVRAMHDWLDDARPGASICIIDSGNAASQAIAKKCGYAYWCEADMNGAPIGVYRRIQPAS